jgi:hypothetical protein
LAGLPSSPITVGEASLVADGAYRRYDTAAVGSLTQTSTGTVFANAFVKFRWRGPYVQNDQNRYDYELTVQAAGLGASISFVIVTGSTTAPTVGQEFTAGGNCSPAGKIKRVA